MLLKFLSRANFGIISEKGKTYILELSLAHWSNAFMIWPPLTGKCNIPSCLINECAFLALQALNKMCSLHQLFLTHPLLNSAEITVVHKAMSGDLWDHISKSPRSADDYTSILVAVNISLNTVKTFIKKWILMAVERERSVGKLLRGQWGTLNEFRGFITVCAHSLNVSTILEEKKNFRDVC